MSHQGLGLQKKYLILIYISLNRKRITKQHIAYMRYIFFEALNQFSAVPQSHCT